MEAIWMGVFVSSFLVPTTYLMQNAKMGLDASWSQRTAARNEAINDNCSNFEVVLPPVNITAPRGVISEGGNFITNKLITNIVRCTKKDAETGMNSNEKFWKRMEKEAQNNSFKAIIADVSKPSMVPAYEGRSDMVHQNLNMGGRTMTFYSRIPQIAFQPVFLTTSKLMVPTDDTFTFENKTYAAGHDKQIWKILPNGSARNLYSKVFPSK
jgi:hypothetical protein